MYAIVDNEQVIKTIRPGRSFEYQGIKYSERWQQRMSAEAKAALGIMEIVQGPRADERFAWVSPSSIRILDGKPVQTYFCKDKDLDELKAQWIAQEKVNANSALASTDWMVIRKAERGVAIPEDVAAARQAIIDACEEKEAAITAAETVGDLIDAIAPGAVKSSSIPVYEDPVEEVVEQPVVQEVQAEPEVIEEVVIEVPEEITLVTATDGTVDGADSVLIEGNSDV